MCSMLLYLPLYINIGLASFAVRMLFGYYHLWYLSAMAIGLIFIFLAEKYKCCNYWLIFLIFAGAVFCEYYKLFDSKALSFVARLILVVGGARHALFFAIPLMLIGHYIAHHTPTHGVMWYMLIFFILEVFSFFEVLILKHFLGTSIRLDISIFGWMPAVPIFLLGINTQTKKLYQ